MAFAPCVLLFALCGLTFLTQASQAGSKNFYNEPVELDDFDEVAREFVQKKGSEAGQTVLWWDMYGRNKHLVDNPQYHKYKIRIWSKDVKYGEVEKILERPGYVYSQWFHNAQTVPVITEFSREVVLQSTYTWSVSKSIKINTAITATAGIPGSLGIDLFFNSSVDLQESQAQTTFQRETYKVKNTLTIPPKKSVRAEFVVTEKDIEVPWEAEVQIDGWVAIWFKNKYNGHYLWFYELIGMANERFPKTAEGNRLHYNAKGTFSGMRGVDSVLKTYEYDLVEEAHLSPDAQPIRVAVYRPHMIKLSDTKTKH